MKEFVLLFCEYQIDHLSAEREFFLKDNASHIGHDWLEYLLSQPMISFRIRIRETELLGDGQNQLSTRIVFSHLQIGQRLLLKRKRILWGHQVYVGALRLEDNSLLTMIAPSYCHSLIDDYALRWSIETAEGGRRQALDLKSRAPSTLFGIFKRRGFNLEDSHLVDSERLSRLFALSTIALCWAYRTGQWLSQPKPISIKTHGTKAQSIFRYGFDHLRSILLDLEDHETDFLQSLQFLSCT